MSDVKIMAGVVSWEDGPACMDACLDALSPWVDDVVVCEGAIEGVDLKGIDPGYLFRSQAEKFNLILEEARSSGADWLLKVDADEILGNGDRLHQWLDYWSLSAFPLPVYYQGLASGKDSVPHACKLIHVDSWKRYLHCNVLESISGEVFQVIGWNLSPWSAARYGVPYLDHRPDLREGVRATIRLSEIEDQIERIPAGIAQWPK